MSWENQEYSLIHDGVDIHSRSLAALEPDYFLVDEFSTEELLEKAKDFAQYINYYNEKNEIDGTWTKLLEGNAEDFIRFLKNPQSFETSPLKKKFSKPHVALFLTFLQLYQHARASFDNLTHRHLDYYYREILQLKIKAPHADHVHLLFELKKHTKELPLPANTVLSAGKDSTGKNVEYVTDKDIVLNHAQVAQVYNLHRDANGNIFRDDAPSQLIKPERSEQGWKTFGTPKTGQQARLGFVIASPLLFFTEGSNRTIELKFVLTKPDETKFFNNDYKDIIQFKLSTAKGMIDVLPEKITGSAEEIGIKITLNDKTPPIEPLDKPITGLPLSKYPLLKLTWLRNPKNSINKIELIVHGNDLKPQLIRNNYGSIDIKKPFLPFGAESLVDNSLQFTHPELMMKPPVHIDVNLKWVELLKGTTIEKYYEAYKTVANSSQTDPIIKIDDTKIGKVKLDLIEKNTPVQYKPNEGKFNKLKEVHLDFNYPNIPEPIDLPKRWTTESLNKYRHLKLSLAEEGFLVEYYPILLDKLVNIKTAQARKNIAQAVSTPTVVNTLATPNEDDGSLTIKYTITYSDDDKEPKPTIAGSANNPSPNSHSNDDEGLKTTVADSVDSSSSNSSEILPDSLPLPLVPKLKDLSFDYTASTSSSDLSTKPYLQIFPLHPSGYSEAIDFKGIAGRSWVMPLAPQYSNDGELFIGIKNAEPSQNLSILFQVVEGSAMPEAPEVEIEWCYLKEGDKWESLKSNPNATPLVLYDETQNLLESGIIRFAIPEDATLNSQLMPSNLIWLRGIVNSEEQTTEESNGIEIKSSIALSNSVCDLLTIHTQAVRATLKDNANDASHYQTPLQPATISKLVNRIQSISKIIQPYPSFDGRPPEPESNFYTRVSERLRHKNRAISPWDYERLILEHFTDIYKVKCLPTIRDAGKVTIVVVPDRRSTRPTDPLHPKASLSQLESVKNFIQKFSAPFVEIEVVNPVYETVRLELQVKFMPGLEKGFYIEKLKEDIVRYLSPWAFDMGAEITFDRVIYSGAITYFIQDLPYVEYLAGLGLFNFDKEGNPVGPRQKLIPKNPRSIWVSDKEHFIKVLDKEMPDEGIGIMRVDYDFYSF